MNDTTSLHANMFLAYLIVNLFFRLQLRKRGLSLSVNIQISLQELLKGHKQWFTFAIFNPLDSSFEGRVIRFDMNQLKAGLYRQLD